MTLTKQQWIVFFVVLAMLGVWFVLTIAQAQKIREEQFINARHEIERQAFVETLFKDISIEAKGVYVVDQVQHQVLYAKNPDTVFGIASIVKLVTADVVMRGMGEDAVITISKESLIPTGDSGLQEGDQLRRNDLLAHMLIASSNDAAEAFRLKEPVLLSRMNARTTALRLYSLQFDSVSGLDAKGNITAFGTPEDVATFVDYFYTSYPELSHMTAQKDVVLATLKERAIATRNTNVLIDGTRPFTLSKTGYTDTAQGALAVVVEPEPGYPITIVVLGSTFEKRFSDVDLLLSKAKEYVSFVHSYKK